MSRRTTRQRHWYQLLREKNQKEDNSNYVHNKL